MTVIIGLFSFIGFKYCRKHCNQCQLHQFHQKKNKKKKTKKNKRDYDEGAHCVNRGCVALSLISKFRVIPQLERFIFFA